MKLALDYPRIRTTTIFVSLRNMNDSWLSNKGRDLEIQYFADRNDRKMFHDALIMVYCSNSSGVTLLLTADGSRFLIDKNTVLELWIEHFNIVY